MEHNSYYNPGGLSGAGVINTPRWRSAQCPSTNAHGTANGVARVYAALISPADPAIVDPAALEEAIAEQVYGQEPGPAPAVPLRPRLSAHPARTARRTRPGHVRPLRRRRFARLRRPRKQDRLRLRDEPDGPALAEPPHPRPGGRRLRIPGAVTFPERRRLTVVVMGDVAPARRKYPRALSLTIVTLAVLAAGMVFTVLNTSRIGPARVGLSAVLCAAVLLYAASGRVITSRRPDNAIGWLLGSIGLAVAVSMFAEQYALYGVATAPGAVPAAKAVGCAAAARRLRDRVPAVPHRAAVPRRPPAVAALAAGAVGDVRRVRRLGHPAVPGRRHRHRRAHQRAAGRATPPTGTRWASCPATAGTAACSR